LGDQKAFDPGADAHSSPRAALLNVRAASDWHLGTEIQMHKPMTILTEDLVVVCIKPIIHHLFLE
jgi:hypothetical protein